MHSPVGASLLAMAIALTANNSSLANTLQDTLSPLIIGPFVAPGANLLFTFNAVEPQPVMGSGKTTSLSTTDIERVIHE
ncbi:exported hypothetical protein [Pseudomonas sp. IT-P74]